MNAEIVSIGTEILMGEIVDTNSGYLAAELARLGIEVHWVSKAGDNPERLYDVLDRAWHRSDVTITTGGLGPTSDDLTRETIARVFGEEMTVQEDLLEHLKELFAGRGMPMPATNVKQATLIPSARSIPNSMGTAPGWWAEKNGHAIIAMPGPPRELSNMWASEVSPRLKERNPGIAIVTKTIKTFGMSEGGMDEVLSDLFVSTNPLLGIYARQDGIHLRAIATAPTEAEALALIAPMDAEIRRRLAADTIWGEDDETAEAQLAAALRRNGLTLGVMEGFTGGLLASTLAEIADHADFLRGSLMAAGPGVVELHGVDGGLLEEHGLVSAAAAEAMARAAARTFGADVGLSVTALSAEQSKTGDPVGTCYVGFAVDGSTSSTSARYPSRRLRIRSRAVTHAMLGLVRALRP